jgi:hypothetical protein
VHLQYLGHPIANDPIYANRRVFGPDLGKGGSGDDDDIVVRLARMGKYEQAQSVAYEEIIQHSKKAEGEKLSGDNCEICDTELYSDPGLNELELWLHAQKYVLQIMFVWTLVLTELNLDMDRKLKDGNIRQTCPTGRNKISACRGRKSLCNKSAHMLYKTIVL